MPLGRPSRSVSQSVYNTPSVTSSEARLASRCSREARGKPSFGKRYSDFIASAANHMTLVAPFIPALKEILSRKIT